MGPFTPETRIKEGTRGVRRGLGVPAAAPRAARRQHRGRSIPSSRSLGVRPAGSRVGGRGSVPAPPDLDGSPGSRLGLLLGRQVLVRSVAGAVEAAPPAPNSAAPSRDGGLRGGSGLRRASPASPPSTQGTRGGSSKARVVWCPRSLRRAGPRASRLAAAPQGSLTPPTLDKRGQCSPAPTPRGLSCSVVEGAPLDGGCFSVRRSSHTACPSALERGALPLSLLPSPISGRPDGLPRNPTRPRARAHRRF